MTRGRIAIALVVVALLLPIGTLRWGTEAAPCSSEICWAPDNLILPHDYSVLGRALHALVSDEYPPTHGSLEQSYIGLFPRWGLSAWAAIVAGMVVPLLLLMSAAVLGLLRRR